MENWTDHIKEQFDNLRISPSRRVWSNMQFEMGRKKKPSIKFSTASKYVISLIAVLAVSVAMLHRDPFTVQHIITIEASSPMSAIMPGKLAAGNSSLTGKNLTQNLSSSKMPVQDELNNLSQRPIVVANSQDDHAAESSVSLKEEDRLDPINSLAYRVSSKNISDNPIGNYKNSYKKLAIASNGFYIGVTTTGQLDWVIDKAKISSPEFTYLLTPGYSYGFRSGYIHNWISIETGYNFRSVEGQNYQNANNQGNLALAIADPSTTVKLDYWQLPFIVKFKSWGLSSVTNHPYAFDIYTGVQLNAMQKATLTVENENYNADNYFKNQSVSAILGLDYELFTRRNVFFTFGSQITYGSDISQNETTQLPQIFSHPHSLTVGIKLAANFQLK